MHPEMKSSGQMLSKLKMRVRVSEAGEYFVFLLNPLFYHQL